MEQNENPDGGREANHLPVGLLPCRLCVISQREVGDHTKLYHPHRPFFHFRKAFSGRPEFHVVHNLFIHVFVLEFPGYGLTRKINGIIINK